MKIKNLALASFCAALLAAACTIVLAQVSVQTDESSVEINGDGVSVESGNNRVNVRNSDEWDNTDNWDTPRTPRQPRTQRNTVQPQQDRNPSRNQGISIIQTQESTINISSNNLRKPNTLIISGTTPGTQLNGDVRVNGVVVQRLRNNRTQINLSPRLSKGSNTIEISGGYRPTTSSVQILLSGPNTRISQQTQGNGILNQTLIVNVD